MRAALPLVALLLLSAGCVLPTSELDAGAADVLAGLAPTLARSLAVDPTRWSGEPSILALDDGTLLITGAGGLTRYATAPQDILGQFGQSYLWRSTDAGATWTFVDLGLPAPATTLLPYRNAILGVEGDLAQDEAGRAYFVDLAALAGNGLSASDDGGATWTAVQNPLVGLPATDRPWVAAYGDGIVYVKYLHMAGDFRAARSTDGGATFPEDVELPDCGQGAPVADVAAREILVACNTGEELWLFRTADGPMAWERVDAVTAEGDTNNVFVALAVAQTGHYLFTWSETSDTGARVRLAASADRGATWSAPITLSTPDRTAVFPWVDANADGVVGVVWYEADAPGAPDELEGAWRPVHARLQLADDGSLSAPAITLLSADAVHEGPICVSGLGCVLSGRSDERRLLDFFEIDVDAAGVSHVAWTSTLGEHPVVWYGQVS